MNDSKERGAEALEHSEFWSQPEADHLPASPLREHMRKQIRKALLAAQRVPNRDDTSAVKDVRVALRRVRALLRLLASLFPKGEAESLRRQLRSAARALGELRDDEVICEAIEALADEAKCAPLVRPWLDERRQAQAEMREKAAELLASGRVQESLESLWSYCAVPEFGTRRRRLSKVAYEGIWRAQAEVEEGRHISPHDMIGLHDLRLCYKRLRYAIEPFRYLLAPEMLPMRLVAKHMQTRLGEIHDLDILLALVRADPRLPDRARVELGSLIQTKRRVALTLYFEDAAAPNLVSLAAHTHGEAAKEREKLVTGAKSPKPLPLPKIARQPLRRRSDG